LDQPVVSQVGVASLGLYGGNRAAGARKNEDGAIVWSGADWVLAVVLDGHGGSGSVNAMIDVLRDAETPLLDPCEKGDFHALQQALIQLLTGQQVAARMGGVLGETACLICYQRGAYLFWLSIGDNTLYLLHPELAALGQHTLTVRNYYEWIGEHSSLSGTPPCFSTGIRQLRLGENTILLVTDGIQEMPGRPFEPASALAEEVGTTDNVGASLLRLLIRAHTAHAVDSCTLVGWSVNNPHPALGSGLN
jgi:serine/threonine protein phosphatase PrpC